MSNTSVLILRAAGINCDNETAHAFRLAGASTVTSVHINEFIHRRQCLSDYDIFVLSGGFSYGDDISGGKVLANELQCRLMEDIEKFIADEKLILGICNGFQVLVKMGLLPQTMPCKRNQEATVFYNDSGKFECRWVYLERNSKSPCVFTKEMPETIYIPVANGEGKVVMASPDIQEHINVSGHVPLRYINPPWENSPDPIYPWSPNGSVDNIAGLCDTTGRIFGLMPHPERYTAPTHHPRWTREGCREPDGLYIFRNAVNYVQGTQST
tara:strand:- start:31891 stop:32697 length:807 start_codon:yes stop_codon:yes gene_type:complete